MFFNTIKTVVLLAALSGLLLFLGHLFGGMVGIQIALIMALLINGIMYFFSDKIVLNMYGAKPLDRHQYAWIYDIVEELCATMKLPMPTLWLIHSNMANAFATGRSPAHASVALTTGILALLDHDELRGVLAHELAHVKNRDILITTIAATLATAIGYLANMLHHAAFWSSMRNNKDRRHGNPIIMLLIALLMPLAATLLQLALSRSREYQADETGAHESHDPLSLASALKKLHSLIPHEHLNPDNAAQAATAPLFIVNPLSGKNILSLFSTHPPVERRIERLKKMFERGSFERPL